jgi:predicted kinase
MREWMRERMRRRSKRGPNNSESTGKIGQELPASGLAPLSPSYLDEGPAKLQEEDEPEGASVVAASVVAEPAVTEPAAEPERRVVPRRGRRKAVAAPEITAEVVEPVPQGAAEPAIASPEIAPEAEPVASPEAPAAAGKLVLETQPESPSIPPPEAQVAAPAGNLRGPRGFVVLAIGLPGSGKTTWFKRRGVQPLSSDMLRSILFDDITEQRYQGLVFSTLRSLLRARLIAKMPWNYVDATNLSPHERRQWIKMAKSFGYEVQAVFFDVPLEVCLERNSRRERVVNDEIMQKMAERLRPPSFKEGFSKITVVRVKGATPLAPLPEPPAAE